MAREKFQTLTEQMFYILLCLRREQCGADIMAQVSALTAGRVSVGPGTVSSFRELSPGRVHPGDQSRGPQAELSDHRGGPKGPGRRVPPAANPDGRL